MTRRRTIIFSAATVGLFVTFFIAAVGMVGFFPTLFNKEFSRNVAYADLGDTPCPTEGAHPVPSEGVGLRILNTTSTVGLAGSVANYFEDLGYTIVSTDNSAPYRGSVQISAGPLAVDAAYTVARYLGPGVRIVLTRSDDMTLTLLLGQMFEGTPGEAETKEITESIFSLVPIEGCLPLAPDEHTFDYVQSEEAEQQSQVETGSTEPN